MKPGTLIGASGSALLLTGLLFYLTATEGSRLNQAAASRAGMTIEQGALLYSLHCRTCHGVRGEGVGQLGPPLSTEHFFSARLTEVGWQATLAEYITATTEQGRMMGTRPIYAGNGTTAVMPPWLQRYGGPLRPDQVTSLTSFILNWEDTATGKVQLTQLALPEINPQDPQIIARGRLVFKEKCGSCHRYGEIEAPPGTGPDLSTIAVTAATRRQGMEALQYIQESVLVPGATVVSGYADAAAADPCGPVLTESELTAVSGFLLQ